MRENSGYFPILVWDAGLHERRLQVYPNYKHHADRQAELAESIKAGLQQEGEEDEYLYEYRTQRGDIMEVCGSLGIPSIRVQGWEGDDLMKICAMMSDDSVVLTDDKDLIQLLSPTTKIARPMADELLTYDEYQAEHDDPGMRKFVISKAIIGDASDNIPKCAPGVGGVTANTFAKIICENPDTWKDIIGESNRKAWKSFMTPESLEQFEINMELIDLTRVEISDEVQSMVARSISTGLGTPNYFSALANLGKFQIEKFDLDFMVSQLTLMCNSVLIDE